MVTTAQTELGNLEVRKSFYLSITLVKLGQCSCYVEGKSVICWAYKAQLMSFTRDYAP